MLRHTSFKLHVAIQHVDEIRFVCNVGKEDIFRRRQLHVFSECHHNSNLTASTPLMCHVFGGRIAVAVEHDDG